MIQRNDLTEFRNAAIIFFADAHDRIPILNRISFIRSASLYILCCFCLYLRCCICFLSLSILYLSTACMINFRICGYTALTGRLGIRHDSLCLYRWLLHIRLCRLCLPGRIYISIQFIYRYNASGCILPLTAIVIHVGHLQCNTA